MATLKHFVLKSEARKLYRDVLRSIRGTDADTAASIRQAAREQFVAHESETDVDRAWQRCLEMSHCSRNAVQHDLTRCAISAYVQIYAYCSSMAGIHWTR